MTDIAELQARIERLEAEARENHDDLIRMENRARYAECELEAVRRWMRDAPIMRGDHD